MRTTSVENTELEIKLSAKKFIDALKVLLGSQDNRG